MINHSNEPKLCNLCERKETETCVHCRFCGAMYNRDTRQDFFLLNRHFTIIEMIDKYCEITKNCGECRAREYCELYVMPDIVRKASKIKNDRSLNFNKLPDKDINF